MYFKENIRKASHTALSLRSVLLLIFVSLKNYDMYILLLQITDIQIVLKLTEYERTLEIENKLVIQLVLEDHGRFFIEIQLGQ